MSDDEEDIHVINKCSKHLKDNPLDAKLACFSCGIDDATIILLKETLRANKVLTELRFGGNYISDIGADSLASVLSENKYLTYIDLSYNRLTDMGIQILFDMLKKNKVLTNINLWGNRTTVKGTIIIMRMRILYERNKNLLKIHRDKSFRIALVFRFELGRDLANYLAYLYFESRKNYDML